MPTVATLAAAAAALVLAACTSGGSTTVEGSPPVGHVVITQLPEQPAHEPEQPLDRPSGPVDRGDPAAVAVRIVVVGLAEQGLEVVDLGVHAPFATSDRVTVRVVATHRGGVSAAVHTSAYELDLSRGPAGLWRLVGHRQAQ